MRPVDIGIGSPVANQTRSDHLVGGRIPQRGAALTGADFQAAGRDFLHHEAGNRAVDIGLVAFCHQICKGDRNRGVFGACGDGTRKTRERRRIVDGSDGHFHRLGCHGIKCAVISLDRESIAHAVDGGGRCPNEAFACGDRDCSGGDRRAIFRERATEK